MSLFSAQTIACPSCGKDVEFDVNFSINADRRPDLRAAILDGSFQVQACTACDKPFRLEPEVTYVDQDRGQWILARPAPRRAEWPQLEQDARDSFALAHGPGAGRIAREMGAALSPRVVFGWAALREKIVCREAGLDDITLELTKLVLMRGLPETPFRADTELRLGAVQDQTLAMAWIRFADEALVESLQVPRTLYDEIAAAPQDWRSLREAFADARYIDLARLLVAAEPLAAPG